MPASRFRWLSVDVPRPNASPCASRTRPERSFSTIPERTEITTAQRFAESHGDWIATRLARVPERIAFDRGAVIPFRGVPHRVVHWTSMRGPTQATKSPSGEPIIAVSGDAPHVGRRVREFLEAEAKRDLAAAVKRHTRQLGVAAKRITVRDTKSRWGSCSARAP